MAVDAAVEKITVPAGRAVGVVAAVGDTESAETLMNMYNAHYDRPTVLGLLGDVTGSRVLMLDVARGLYLAKLKTKGAETAGFDHSADVIRVARQRLCHTTDPRCHDLDEPLHWLDDHTVDLVLAALMIHHVDDHVGALREPHRVLRPSGRLVPPTNHPTAD